MRIDELKRIAKENGYDLEIEVLNLQFIKHSEPLDKKIYITATSKEKQYIVPAENLDKNDKRTIRAVKEFCEVEDED